MKRFSTVILGLVVAAIFFVLFLAVARAEEESEARKCFRALEGVEKLCPLSLSEEQHFLDFLSEIDQQLDQLISRHRMSFDRSSVENLWDLLALQQRVKEILKGPCCARVRALKGTRELLFKGFE